MSMKNDRRRRRLEGVKKSLTVILSAPAVILSAPAVILSAPAVILSAPAVILSAAKDLRSCFCSNYLRRTAGMLRCAQHDRIEFLHTCLMEFVFLRGSFNAVRASSSPEAPPKITPGGHCTGTPWRARTRG